MSLISLWEAVTGRDKDKPADRRSAPRLPAHGLVSIRRDAEGAEAEAVSLIGLSEHGFSFRAASSIPLGERIVAEPQACAYEAFEPVEAVVRHCTEDGEGFVIGAEILSPDGEPAAAPSDAEAALVEGVEEAI